MFAQTILVGHLGRDPEIRDAGASQVATLNVATNYSYKDRNGEWVKKTEWTRVKVWGKQAKTVSDYLHKGSLVMVVGRPETESWEKDGEKKYSTVVIADKVQFLDGRTDTEGEAPEEPRSRVRAAAPAEITDDDIPF